MNIGKWIILGESEERANDGHRLYNAKCEKCGYIYYNAKKSFLSRTAFKEECHHFSLNVWFSPRLSHIYRNMLSRCYRKEAKDYRFYGGKGIKVCKEWKENPSWFNDWAINNGYHENLTIDRIDSKKDYCPENCRWVDNGTNSKLKITTRLLKVNNITDSISGWAKRLNMPKNTLVKNLRQKTDKEAIDFIYSRLVQ